MDMNFLFVSKLKIKFKVAENDYNELRSGVVELHFYTLESVYLDKKHDEMREQKTRQQRGELEKHFFNYFFFIKNWNCILTIDHYLIKNTKWETKRTKTKFHL